MIEELCLIKATLLISVPRIFSRWAEYINSRLENHLKSAGDLTEEEVKVHRKMVFAKVRESFGNSLRIVASGSAPTNPDVHHLI
jgi:long-subunit acyl-CoA synthetase (AMP-forming)